MLVPSVLVLTMALMTGGAAERFAGLEVSRVELVPEGATLPEVAHRLVDIEIGKPFDLASVRRSIKQLFALGIFSDIKVEAQVEDQGVAIIFRLYPDLRVEEIVFLGLDRAPETLEGFQEELVEESGIQPRTLLDPAKVEQAVEKLIYRLAEEGYFWASAEPEIQFLSNRALVLFHIEPGPQAYLGALRVRGVAPHIERDVKKTMKVAPGSPYSPRAVRERIEHLVTQWKENGYYEVQVDFQEATEVPGRIDVDIRIELGRRVLVEVQGVELTDRVLKRLIPVLREQSVSEDLIQESQGNLEAYFIEQGYRDAVATLERSTVGGGQYLLLKFHVDPGRRIRVGEVRVEGLSTLAPQEVLSSLATRPGRFRASLFRPQIWEEDLDEIRDTLRRQGFHQATVHGELHERDGAPEVVDLTAHVEEGPRALIEAIQVEGAEQVSPTEVLSATALEVGAPFYAPQVAEARERLLSLFRNRGFQQAVVEVETGLDPTGTRASLSFEIQEGLQTIVDRVILSGLEVTREEALRREITVRPQAPLSAEGILETRQRLVGTGLFSDVSVETLPFDPSNQSSDVLIQLEEGPRTSFGYGFGYNERDLARAEAELTRRNLFGRNRTASIFGRVSFKGGRAVVTYRQPELLGLDVPAFVSAFYEDGERKGFDFIQRGVGLQVSRNLSETQTFFFRYNFRKTRVFRFEFEEPLPREFRNVRLSTVSVSQVTDTRDDPITPSQGQFRLLDLEISAKFLGTEVPYLKGLAQQFFYFRLPHRMVGVIGLRLGVGQTLGQQVDILMPITERFFAGGANTLRGFGLDLASPKDARGNPLGGNVVTLLNMELRFPIAAKLGGVIFSDNGAVYRRLSVIELLKWRYNLGFGFRYETPLGPLRVDVGFKLDRRLTSSEEGPVKEPLSRIHVSLGHAF